MTLTFIPICKRVAIWQPFFQLNEYTTTTTTTSTDTGFFSLSHTYKMRIHNPNISLWNS